MVTEGGGNVQYHRQKILESLNAFIRGKGAGKALVFTRAIRDTSSEWPRLKLEIRDAMVADRASLEYRCRSDSLRSRCSRSGTQSCCILQCLICNPFDGVKRRIIKD